jgi:hypothetical protein
VGLRRAGCSLPLQPDGCNVTQSPDELCAVCVLCVCFLCVRVSSSPVGQVAFPKGVLEATFHRMYENDVMSTEAFLAWKDRVDDTSAKGTALIQLARCVVGEWSGCDARCIAGPWNDRARLGTLCRCAGDRLLAHGAA